MGERPDMKERMKGKGADIFFENTSVQKNEHTTELDSIIDLDNDSKLQTVQDSAIDNAQATEQDTDKNTDKDTNNVTDKDTTQYTEQCTNNVTTQCTTQCTNNVTANVTNKKDNNKYIIQIEKTAEPYNRRLVANVTATQKQYIKTVAKKNKIKESELVRLMIDFFIENFDFK